MKVASLEPGHAKFKVPMSLWTYGEKIDITLSETIDGLLVDIRSECSWPVQIEDWGRNQKNVKFVFGAIGRRLSDSDSYPVPFCSKCSYLLAFVANDQCPECGSHERSNDEPRPSNKRRIANMLCFAVILTLVEVFLIMFGRWLGFNYGIGPITLVLINLTTVTIIWLIGLIARRKPGQVD